jgi:hypothetical protein
VAEVLLRIADKQGVSNPSLALRGGDVIAVCADGWAWTARELSNPEWLVVKLPGVDPALLMDLLNPVMVNLGTATDPNIVMALKRGKTIDMTLPRIQAFLATKVLGTVTIPANLVDRFISAKLTRTVPAQVTLG